MLKWFKKLFNGDLIDTISSSFDPVVAQSGLHVDVTTVHEKEERQLPNFESMTKAQIDEWAKEKEIKLDRRKKKETMIKELINHLNKEK